MSMEISTTNVALFSRGFVYAVKKAPLDRICMNEEVDISARLMIKMIFS